jgi:predicted O-methyltransferase YrrM
MSTTTPIAPAELVQRYQAELASITELEVPSMHLFAQLLEYQTQLQVAGDMLEIGVFRAGTAALLAAKLREKERLFLIDPTQNEVRNRQTIEAFAKVGSEQLLFHVQDSLAVNKWREQILTPQVPLVRFAHIDGEHSYDAVYSDLELARRYLSGGGLLVLDDIFNMNSACCTHAMFDYLRAQPLVQCVAMGFHKAYLCESRHMPVYRRFFLEVPNLLAGVGVHVRLSFNSWGYERSYLTMEHCEPNAPHYQTIGQRHHRLADALAAVGIGG